MQLEITRWSLVSLALSGTVLAQARTAQTSPLESSHAPALATIVRPGQLPAQAPPTFNRFMGEARQQAVTLDDEVPRPGNALSERGEHPDQPIATAAQNPFFLGFAAGSYYPPADERIDPELLVAAQRAQARGAKETYAFVMFAKRMTPERMTVLAALGVRAIEFHPQYCVKVALPPAEIDRVAALDFVRWIGVAKSWQKVHPKLAEIVSTSEAMEPIDVYIDVFDSDMNIESVSESVGTQALEHNGVIDAASNTSASPARIVHSNGPQQRLLEALGIEVHDYDDGIRAFRARVRPEMLESLVAQDFVQFVEPNLPRELAHDESTPMLGNDIVRYWYPGNTSGAISIGHIDSGVDISHGALAIGAWGMDYSGSGTPFTDGCGHGSHTLGTILGDGFGSYSNSGKGVAPGLARGSWTNLAFTARIFDNFCNASGTPLSTVFSQFENDYNGFFGVTPRPVAINCSFGTPGYAWIGSEADARTIDNEVFNHDQLYVWAAGNEGYNGSSSMRLEASAKNAMAVGALTDFDDPNTGFPGTLLSFSSRGPCGDGRWKPNVTAPGALIRSVAAGTYSGYVELAGTSSSAAHVTGLAAAISDAISWLRYQPAAVASVLMSSAETKNDSELLTPSDIHLNLFGAGKVEQHKAVLGSSDYYWNTWAFVAPGSSYSWADFYVPAGTKRITIAMNYYEPASSAGASQALVNNWDLYIDDPVNGIAPAGNSGDYTFQQSSRDNCEIRTLNLPTVGTWRWKAYPQSVGFAAVAKMGVTVTFELNTTQCNPTFDISTSTPFVKPNQTAYIDANITNFAGLASSASINTYASGNIITSAHGGLFDGSQTELIGNLSGGRNVVLGDIPPYYGRDFSWETNWSTEGVKYFSASAIIDNFFGAMNEYVTITVDGTPPPAITGWHSFTHTPSVWSTNETCYLAWNVAADNLSGVQGYSALTSQLAPIDPGQVLSFGANSTMATQLPSSNYPYYVTLRCVDNCDNWTNYVATGPYYVDAIAPQGPFNLQSTSHNYGSSCDTTVDLIWSAALDYESSIAGYVVTADTNATTVPTGALNAPQGATSATITAPATTGVYCHVRAQDYAGNWSATLHLGPLNIYANGIIATYCTAKTNSLGCVSNLTTNGTPSATAANGFTISCSNVLNQKNGMLIYSLAGRNAAPFQGGVLCVHSPVRRTVIVSSGGNAAPANNCSGVYSFDFNAFARGSFATTPAPELSVAGTVVDAQWWGRDPGFAAPNNTALSRGVEFVMCY